MNGFFRGQNLGHTCERVLDLKRNHFKKPVTQRLSPQGDPNSSLNNVKSQGTRNSLLLRRNNATISLFVAVNCGTPCDGMHKLRAVALCFDGHAVEAGWGRCDSAVGFPAAPRERRCRPQGAHLIAV